MKNLLCLLLLLFFASLAGCTHRTPFQELQVDDLKSATATYESAAMRVDATFSRVDSVMGPRLETRSAYELRIDLSAGDHEVSGRSFLDKNLQLVRSDFLCIEGALCKKHDVQWLVSGDFSPLGLGIWRFVADDQLPFNVAGRPESYHVERKGSSYVFQAPETAKGKVLDGATVTFADHWLWPTEVHIPSIWSGEWLKRTALQEGEILETIDEWPPYPTKALGNLSAFEYFPGEHYVPQGSDYSTLDAIGYLRSEQPSATAALDAGCLFVVSIRPHSDTGNLGLEQGFVQWSFYIQGSEPSAQDEWSVTRQSWPTKASTSEHEENLRLGEACQSGRESPPPSVPLETFLSEFGRIPQEHHEELAAILVERNHQRGAATHLGSMSYGTRMIDPLVPAQRPWAITYNPVVGAFDGMSLHPDNLAKADQGI